MYREEIELCEEFNKKFLGLDTITKASECAIVLCHPMIDMIEGSLTRKLKEMKASLGVENDVPVR